VGRGTRPGHGAIAGRSTGGLTALQHGRAAGILDPGTGRAGAAALDPGEGHGGAGGLAGCAGDAAYPAPLPRGDRAARPRGATVAENETAIDAVATEFSAAIADPDRYGLAKTMALAAGLDQPEATEAFLQGGPETLPEVDPEVVLAAMARQARLTALNAERKMPQLPVCLPAQEELAAASGRSKVVGQFRALAEWLGPQGRELTSAKNIRPSDARDLIALLDTGDEGLKFRSAAELPGLNLVVSWALRPRIIRRQGTRLLPVAKARSLHAEALWQRAFETAFAIGDAVCRPAWADEPPSPVQQTYDMVVPDLLAPIYSMEEPVPVPRLTESVWQGSRPASTWITSAPSSWRACAPARTGTWSTSSTPSKRSAR
jgi:hypothetical protein